MPGPADEERRRRVRRELGLPEEMPGATSAPSATAVAPSGEAPEERRRRVRRELGLDTPDMPTPDAPPAAGLPLSPPPAPPGGAPPAPPGGFDWRRALMDVPIPGTSTTLSRAGRGLDLATMPGQFATQSLRRGIDLPQLPGSGQLRPGSFDRFGLEAEQRRLQRGVQTPDAPPPPGVGRFEQLVQTEREESFMSQLAGDVTNFLPGVGFLPGLGGLSLGGARAGATTAARAAAQAAPPPSAVARPATRVRPPLPDILEEVGQAAPEPGVLPVNKEGVQPPGTAMQAGPTRPGLLLQRIEEPGIPQGSPDKPQGLYTFLGDRPNPIADADEFQGGEISFWRLSPDAKVLHLPKGREQIPIRRMALDSGAGVHVAKSLLDERTFLILRRGTKEDAIKFAEAQFPGPDYRRYRDKQEVIEAIGGQMARKQGYDAIYDHGGNFPGLPDEDEIVLLNEKMAQREAQPLSVPRQPPGTAMQGSMGAFTAGPEPRLPRPPFHMSPEELDAHVTRVRQYERDLEVEMFGEEGAKRYRKAPLREKDRMVGALTPAQQERFEGRLLPGEESQSADHLSRTFFQGESVTAYDSEPELLAALGRNLYKVDPERLGAFQAGTGSLTYEEQASGMVIREAVAELAKRGWAQEQIFKAAGEQLEDGEFLLRRWLAFGNKRRPPADDIPFEQAALASPAPPQQAGAMQGGMGIGERPPVPPAAAPPTPPAGAPPAVPPAPPSGGVPPPSSSDPVAKLTSLIKQAKPLRAETEALKSVELRQRAARAASILERGQGREAFRASKTPLAGELPVAQFTPPETGLGPDEVTGLFNTIRDASRPYFVRLNTYTALEKVLTGQIPQQAEIRLLEDMFGADFAAAILNKRSLGAKVFANTMDALNLPRAVITSWDASAPLRQGIVLGPGHVPEFAQSFGAMVKAMAREANAVAVDSALKSNPHWQIFQDHGLYHAERLKVATNLADREEVFMSRLARRIPGVKVSERGYVTFLNKLRFDVMNHIYEGWVKSGKEVSDADLSSLANFINAATGRGRLPKAAQRYAPLLNATFFSPRLQLSRFDAPLQLVQGTRLVRQQAARDLALFVSTGVGVLSLLGLNEGVTVETDPRSSDFGKIRVGNSRIEFWASYQPLARYVAQLMTGQRKTTATGGIIEARRGNTLLRYFRSKLAPVPGFAVDALTGKNFIGEEFAAPKERFGHEVPGALNLALETFVPLFIQDLTEAIEVEGGRGAAMTAPGFFGAGVQTYQPTPGSDANAVAQELYGMNYDDLPEAQRARVRRMVQRRKSPEERRKELQEQVETRRKAREQEIEKRRKFRERQSVGAGR